VSVYSVINTCVISGNNISFSLV